jgi:hypothetical protein
MLLKNDVINLNKFSTSIRPFFSGEECLPEHISRVEKSTHRFTAAKDRITLLLSGNAKGIII